MAITAASVEANGWVLRITLTGSTGSFASYTLAPDGTPRVTLASAHPGFVKSAGTAVSGTINRTLVATKPLRLPVNPASPTVKVIDETDLGGGSIRVRLALSEHVYATDTALTLAVLAGWRTGEGAASGIAVTNNSTVAAPLPIFRWALAPYDVTNASFRLSLFVTSHHPVGLEPVAGVKFTATDGTTVKTIWATTLGTDNSHSDNLRCYTVSIDPATATALTAGLLRCDAEVYPWLGAMRSTDAAGTRSMSALGTAGFASAAQTPFVIGYDPAGTRYGGQFLFVDPAGTSTAAANMVQASHAAAKALATAARPANLATAIQALYLANRTLAAANGQASQARAADGAQIAFAAGTHAGPGSTAVTAGVTTAEIPVRLVGDPDNSDPRSNVIVQTGTSANIRITRARLANLRLEIGTTTLVNSTVIYWLLDNIEVRGKSGQETNSVAPFAPSVPAGQWNIAATRVKWWRSGSRLYGTTLRVNLARACEASRRVEALAAFRHRFISSSEDTSGPTNENGIGGWGSVTDIGAAEDVIVAFNDLRSMRGRAWQPQALAAATAGTPNPSYRRLVFQNNVCERIGSDPQPFWSLGEDESATMSYIVIEGNSFVGERSNTLYSDPLPTTNTETNSLLNQAYVNRVANNAYDWLPTKHDDFADPQTQTVRTAAGVTGATGYRPQMIEAWSVTYGVGFEGNYDAGRTGSGSFAFEYPGRGSTQTTGGAPAYASDRSLLGTGAGGGDYKPAANSPLAGRGVRSNSDRDFNGDTRLLPVSAGGIQVSASALAPLSAVSAHRAAAAGLALVLPLATAGSRHGQRAVAPGVGWAGGIAPAAARQAPRSGTPQIGWFTAVSPLASRHGQRTSASATGWAVAIAAAVARQAQRSGTSLIGWSTAVSPVAGRHGQSARSSALAFLISLAPRGGLLPHAAGRPFIGWAAGLVPAPAVSATTAAAAPLAWAGVLAPDGSGLSWLTASPGLGWSAALAAASTVQVQIAAASRLDLAAVMLVPANVGQALLGAATLLLPGGGAPTGAVTATLRVGGDLRRLLVKHD